MVHDKETINIDLKVPTSWEKLNEKQLRYVFGLIAHGFAMQQIKTNCLFRWSGISPIRLKPIILAVKLEDEGPVLGGQKNIKSKIIMIFRESIPQKS